MIETFEYAGFQYRVELAGDTVMMIPLDGQHVAAWKEKHRMAAREIYLLEQRRKKRAANDQK